MSAVRLPLAHRLPNPPALFVGRHTEAARLKEAVERAPVSVVCGLGGMGKTALVLHTIERHFPERAPQTLMFRVGTGDSPDQVRFELARALATAASARVDWSALMTEPEGIVAAAIDVAERSGLWIVIDDLHHAGAAADELLRLLARYARASRWIATSRVPPALDELAGQIVSLSGLPKAELEELARRCAPDLTGNDRSDAVAHAGGSPWRLRQLLGGGGPSSGRDPFAELPPSACDVLELLALLELPLPAETLARLSPATVPEDLRALERYGFVDRSPAGVRLHDAARPFVAEAWAARVKARAAEAVVALEKDGDPTATLEALRLRATDGNTAAARAILERHGDALLAAGFAPRLWRIVRSLPGDDLARWHLRCGVELGDAAVLSGVQVPPDAALADRLLWARVLYVGGEPAAAATAAEDVCAAARARGNAALAFDAALLALEALSLGDPAAQRRLLAVIVGLELGPADIARRDVYLARCHAVLGEYAAAARFIDRAADAVSTLEPAARWLIRQQLVVVLISLGRIADAARALPALMADAGERALDLYRARFGLLWRAVIATAAGALGEARELMQQLDPLVGPRSAQRPILAGADLHRRLAAGEMEGFADRAADMIARTEAAGNGYFHHQARILALRETILRAGSEPEPPASPRVPPPTGFHAHLLELYRALRRTRAGEREVAIPEFPAGVEVHALAAVVRGLAALLAGDVPRALVAIEAAEEAATDLGYDLHAVEARLARCEVLVAAGRWNELAVAAGALARRAVEMPSPRFSVEAHFFVAAAEAAFPDPSLLEEQAAQADVAPIAARRARVLLGDDAPLDAIDRLVIDSLHRHVHARIARVAGAAAGRGWGLDDRTRQVWLPGGRSVPLTHSPLLWNLLSAVADRGGRASRDELAPILWPGEAYHPVRHNNRFHTTINKARRLIEEEPSAPTRLLTTDDGYCFGDAEPVRRCRTRG